MKRVAIWTVAGVLAAAGAAWGAPTEITAPDGSKVLVYPAGEEPKPEPSPVVRDAEAGVVHFGAVDLVEATRTVVCPGWVNQQRGLVEVLACGEAGKVHEAVLVLEVNTLDFQAALLLAGNKAGEPMPGFGVGPARGSPVDMWVEWTDEASGETRRERAERFVKNTETGGALEDGPWVFTGSVVKDGEFKALAEETLIATYWDPYAIINNPYSSGGNDDILFSNDALVPKEGTKIKFEISPAAEDNPKLDRTGLEGRGGRTRFGY